MPASALTTAFLLLVMLHSCTTAHAQNVTISASMATISILEPKMDKAYRREGFVIMTLLENEQYEQSPLKDGTVIEGEFACFQGDFCMFKDDFDLLQTGMMNDRRSIRRNLVRRIQQLDRIPFERYPRENCVVSFQQHSANMEAGIEAYRSGDIEVGDRMLVFGLENLACHNGVHQLLLTEEQIRLTNDLAARRLEISRKIIMASGRNKPTESN